MKAVAIGELAGEDEGIGLREEHQGVVDHVLVAAVEIVVAQAAVAGHIHRENQDAALAGEAGIDGGFDHRGRGADLRNRLDALQHILAETGISGRDL